MSLKPTVTYRELLKALKTMTAAQLDCPAIAYDPYQKETLPVTEFFILKDGSSEQKKEMADLSSDQPVMLVSF
jgi:hypothetical protein